MYENLLKAIMSIGSPKVLLVGDFMLDVSIYGDAERISPEAPVPILKVSRTDYSCGGAGLVAANLCSLGAVPLCIGVVGDDANGEKLKEMLSADGCDVSGIITVQDRSTTTKRRLIGLAQHRHQQQLFRMDSESSEPLTREQYTQIGGILKDKLGQADIVCLQDYNKGMLADSFCKEAIRLATKAGKKVLIDPSSAGDFSKYAHATLIAPNRYESRVGVGFEIKTIKDSAKAAEQLVRELDLEAAVITLDKEGAYLKSPELSEHIPTRPRNVYDVTGAGDVVLATLAITLASGCDYKTAVQLANMASGIQVEKFGGATVSVKEVVNEIVSVRRSNESKIRSVDSLLADLAWRRKQNQVIVFTNGCFDVIHRGHIEFLKFCRAQGDVVIVGLNSDDSVKSIKGPGRPIHNQHDRAEVLGALEAVGYVVVFDEPDPLNLIEKVKPDVLVKGRDWEAKGVVGADFVLSYGGKVVMAPLVEGKSSTQIIERIRSLFSGAGSHKSTAGQS